MRDGGALDVKSVSRFKAEPSMRDGRVPFTALACACDHGSVPDFNAQQHPAPPTISILSQVGSNTFFAPLNSTPRTCESLYCMPRYANLQMSIERHFSAAGM